jgi:hypothetical protein
MEEWPGSRFAWARALALKILGNDIEVKVAREVSAFPSADRDVVLAVRDQATGYSAKLALSSADRTLEDGDFSRAEVEQWSTRIKLEIEERRRLSGR